MYFPPIYPLSPEGHLKRFTPMPVNVVSIQRSKIKDSTSLERKMLSLNLSLNSKNKDERGLHHKGTIFQSYCSISKLTLESSYISAKKEY